MIIEDGNTYGIMQSMNRIGDIRARSSYAMNTLYARDELGYEGYFVTDYNNIPDGAENLACLAGGCNAQLYNGNHLNDSDMELNGTRYLLRQGTKYILNYSLHTSAMDGYNKNTTYKSGLPVYVLMLVGVDALVVAILGLGIALQLKTFSIENNNITDVKVLKTNKVLRITYWSVVGAIVVAVLIVFFIWGLPLLQQAFKIV